MIRTHRLVSLATALTLSIALSGVRPACAQVDPAAARATRLARIAAIDREMAVLDVNMQRYEAELRRAEADVLNLSSDLNAQRNEAFAAKAAADTTSRQSKLAQGQVTRARGALRIAEGRLKQIEDQLRKLAQVDPALLAAKEEMEAARDQHEKLRDFLLRPVRASEEYTAAVAALADAQQRLDALRDGDTLPSRDAIVAASNLVLARQATITDLERGVIDKSLSFRTTHLTWMRAVLQHFMRRVALSAQLYMHPDRLGAIGFVDQARANLDGAEVAYAAAKSDEAGASATFKNAAARYDTIARDLKDADRDRQRLAQQVLAARNRQVALASERNFQAAALGGGVIRPAPR